MIKCGNNFGHASENQRNDREFVLEDVKGNCYVVSDIPDIFLNDLIIINKASKENSRLYLYELKTKTTKEHMNILYKCIP